MLHKFTLLLSISFAISAAAFAQEEQEEKEQVPAESPQKSPAEQETAVEDKPDDFTLRSEADMPLTIDLDKEDEEDEDDNKKKKKKKKKKVFYGLKTKKGFTKTGFGSDVVIEIYYTLKTPEPHDAYVRDIYYYNYESKIIKKSNNVSEEKGALLHGPYKKMIGDRIIEEGIFYKGTKHGRWMTYNKNDILQRKAKYYKGWPKESKVAYYDREKTKLKEVIPIEYGEKEGNYYYFHENGQVAVSGEYKYGQKVNAWLEFYDHHRRRKKEVLYRKDPFNDNYVPAIAKEWDEDGRLIYEKADAGNSRISLNR